MKYYLNPDYDYKDNINKIKFLESIKSDINNKIKELEEIINLNNIRNILFNCFVNNFDNIKSPHKIIKTINNIILNKYITNEIGNIEICVSFFVDNIEFKVVFIEIIYKNENEIDSIRNKYYWINDNNTVDIKKFKNKILNKINECFEIILKTGLYNLIIKV
jgi:hypothetical protein